MCKGYRFISLALVVMVACLGPGRLSYAQSRGAQSADSHYKKGKKAYTLGHFPEAIEEFEKAYDIKPEPVFLFNIAQSHRQNGNLQRAIFFYRRYLEADPNAKDRADIEKRIKDAESQLSAERERSLSPPAAAPPPAPAPPTVVVMPTPVLPPAAVATTPEPSPKSEGTHGRALVIAGIATGGVGLIGVLGGVLAGVHATNLYNEAYKGQYDASKEESSKTFRTLEWVSFGLGGAALATGAILVVIGVTSKGEKSSIALAPLLAPGAGGASVFGRF